MSLFGGKVKSEDDARAENVPVQQVLRLRQEGLNNNQIVQSLQRSGYRTDQIFDAMNQADMRSAAPLPGAVSAQDAEMVPPPPSAFPEERPPAEEFPSPEMLPPEQYGQQESSPPQPGYAPPEQVSDERIEEIAEAIIEEKWTELVKNVNKIVEWKKAVEARMQQIDEKVGSLKTDIDSLHKALFDRMDSYDQSVSKVGSNLKAMDDVFRKTLPSLTESVSDLSRITSALKAKKKETK